MIEKEALDYLITQGEQKNPIIELKQGTFSKMQLQRIKGPKAATLTISTLTGIVDYIKTNVDKLQGKLLIHVKSQNEVNLYGPLEEDGEREFFISVQAILPNNVVYERFLDTEKFNIMLQSAFVDIGDKTALLKYTGLIKEDNVKSTGDDGISQSVTIKTGIASVGEALVPNPVILAPFRTFPEIEQPTSKFIFRMQDGPSAALFEADGGAWRNIAILRIKEYLQEQLKDVDDIEIIA